MQSKDTGKASKIGQTIGAALGLVVATIIFFAVWPKPSHGGYLTVTERFIAIGFAIVFGGGGSAVGDIVQKFLSRKEE